MKKDHQTKRFNFIRNYDKGFTLVELIVVLTIMAILIGISVFGVIAWQDNARFIKQDEYARTLFNAAQSQLSEYASNQVLDKFDDSVKNSAGVYTRTVDITKIKDTNGEYYDLTKVWYQSAGVNDPDKAKYQGTVCYAKCNAGDYTKYVNGTLESQTGADIVFKLLESSVYDLELLNASICVEFAPADGQVFAVLYSDKHEGFTYGSNNGDVVSIADRQEGVRRENMTGYYGVDTLAVSTHNDGNLRPNLTNVMLLNEETLNLTFRVSNYKELLTQLSYEITVYDADTKLKALVLTLHTSEQKINNYAFRSTVPVSVTKYVYNSAGEATGYLMDNYDMLVWTDADSSNNSRLHLVFDAADVQADAQTYVADLERGLMGGDANGISMDDTFSFHRFGVDADNIYCTVQTIEGKYKASKLKTSNVESAYYASAKLDTKYTNGVADYTYTKKITNARHLYNVRFDEDLTWNERGTYSSKITGAVTENFIVDKNIDWKAFVDEGNLYYSVGSKRFVDDRGNAVVVGKDAAGNDITITYTQLTNGMSSSITYARVMNSCPFPSIGQLRVGDSFVGGNVDISFMSSTILTEEQKDSKAKTVSLAGVKVISNITVTAMANEFLGVYGEGDGIIGRASGDAIYAVGLFAQNHGSINSLAMDKVTIVGDKYVGGFAGINRGDMNCLELRNTESLSYVFGNQNVGGITGYIMPDYYGNASEVRMNFNTNRAKVSGTSYVGGVVGQIVLTENSTIEKITVEYCKNYGVIGAVADTAKGARYIGGIAGRSMNNQAVTDLSKLDRVEISHCVSSSQYSATDISRLLDMTDIEAGNSAVVNALGNQLKGVYVGGIVGYNYFGTIYSCNTEAENGKTGYVFGYQYVGGIVGFNQGPASGIDGSSRNSGKAARGTNAANVVGAKYVGGIVGCNANVDAELTTASRDGIVVPDNARSLDIKTSNWTNRGIVFATDSYAGGITGYNAGWIFNCSSEVGDTGVYDFFQKTYSGNYSGGIAGYNNGFIGNTEIVKTVVAGKTVYAHKLDEKGKVITGGRINAVCYISGINYVGGIVGYNDVDALVEDYELSGGYIRGYSEESCFVGGYAGLNASVNLLMDYDGNAHNIVSNPNEVSGKYFVGGNIGGNIINNSQVSEIRTNFMTNNLLGEMSGEAFVGGFIGYTLIIDNVPTAQMSRAELIASLQKELVEKIDLAEETYANDETTRLVTIDKVIRSITKAEVSTERYPDGTPICMTKVYNPSTCRLVVTGGGMNQAGQVDNTSEYSINSLGVISGKIYVAGVLGLCDDNSNIIIRNVRNTTPVEATAAINVRGQRNTLTDINGAEIDYTGINRTVFTYSYSGGITGRVGRNTIIDNCQNTASATIKTKGIYTGGLCEVNEGIITNCDVYSFGSSLSDYVGGLCGLNKGTISNSRIISRSVSGRNVVGAIAAENFGTIRGINANNVNLTVAGNNVAVSTSYNNPEDTIVEKHAVTAIIAGYNAPTGVVEVSSSDIFENIKIFTRGDYVGTVVGINEGTVENVSASAANTSDRQIVISGSISGTRAVGGFIGWNKSDREVSYIRNNATVTATNGFAGGIIGANVAGTNVENVVVLGITISNCINDGVVTASNAGNAGGITSVNGGTIVNCIDYRSVMAPKGMTGGISAINAGNIIECIVEPKDYSENAETSRLTFSSIEKVGGVTADNYGKVSNCRVYGTDVYNYSTSVTGSIGVMVGINEPGSEISFINANNSQGVNEPVFYVKDCTAKTYTNNSSVGGVVGVNAGIVRGTLNNDPASDEFGIIPVSLVSCEVGYVEGLASVASLGGVAGRNSGKIFNISVLGIINETEGLGNGGNGYGGIAGVSGLTGVVNPSVTSQYPVSIENCTFDGSLWVKGAGTSVARVGGIVGLNLYGSKVTECLVGVYSASDFAGETNGTTIYAGDVLSEDEYGTQVTYPIGDTKIVTEERYITVASDPNSSAYIGGLVGENYGCILSGDNGKYSKDGVEIQGFAGLIGGIVGVMQEGSIVTGTKDSILSSGKNWTVNKRSAGNDESLGGIIGAAYTKFDMEYTDNYAKATSFFRANNKSGGIVGIIQYSDSGEPVTFNHCNNYGTVMSFSSTGGLIGEIYFIPVAAYNCDNWGLLVDLNDTDSREAGGLIARVDNILGEVTIENCRNFGTVSMIKGYAGGILGRYHNTKEYAELGNPTMHITDCVNVGLVSSISGKSTSGTIAGYFDSLGKGIYIQNCRSYGGGSKSASYAFLPIVGKCNVEKTGLYITDCLTDSNFSLNYTSNKWVRNTNNPFIYDSGTASRAFLTNNYYINYLSLQEDNTFNSAEVIADDYGTFFDVSYDFYSGNTVTGTENYLTSEVVDMFGRPEKDSAWRSDNVSTVRYHFDITNGDSASGMKAFAFYPTNFKANDNPFYYNYEITFTDTTGATATSSGMAIGEKIPYATVVEVPSSISHKLSSIDFKISRVKSLTDLTLNGKIAFAGFGWTPEGTDFIVPMTSDLAHKEAQAQATFTLSMSVETYDGKPSYSVAKDKLTNTEGRLGLILGKTVKVWSIPESMDNMLLEDYYDCSKWYQARLYVKLKNNNNKNTGDREKLHFDINYNDPSANLGEFVLYLANNNGDSTGTKPVYRYIAVFTDENGKQATYTRNDDTANTAGQEVITCSVAVSSAVTADGEPLTGKIKSVDIYLWATNSTELFIKGFGWVPAAGSDGTVLPCVYNVPDDWNMQESDVTDIYDGNATSGVTFGEGNMLLYATYDTSVQKYYLYPEYATSLSDSIGFYMGSTNNNPASLLFYNDFTKAEDSKLLGKNYRYAVYEDLDKQYEDVFLPLTYSYFNEGGAKLDTPTVSLAAYNGSYSVMWDAVLNAYKYSVAYVVKDSNGNEIESTLDNPAVVNAGTYSFAVPAKNEWYSKAGNTITFYVRALHLYHFKSQSEDESERTRFDSEEGTVTNATLFMLPTPEIVIEITDRNNSTGNVAVLLNRDDFRDEDGKYIDCEIVVGVGTSGETYKFNPAIAGHSTILKGGNNAEAESYAFAREIGYVNGQMPMKYISSPIMYHSGSIMLNSDLTNDTEAYAAKPTFMGFYGDTSDNLSYKINYALGSTGKDCYTVSDISAYDDELMVDIAYSYGITHTAANHTAGTTDLIIMSELAGLPSDIIGKTVTARTYFYETQQHFIRAGHYVAQGIDKETLKKYISGELVDHNYMDTNFTYKKLYQTVGAELFAKMYPTTSPTSTNSISNFVLAVDNPICNAVLDSEGNVTGYQIKNGYVIYDNQNGTYDIFFSSPVARTLNEKKTRLTRYVTYTPDENDENLYNLSMSYSANASNPAITVIIDGVEMTEQRIQPKPEIDIESEEGVNANGKREYRFTWDNDENGDAKYPEALYSVELFGYSTTQSEWISIGTINRQNANNVAFVDEQSNWNYTRFRLQVTRIGTTVNNENAGQSIVLPNSSEQEFIIKQKLDTISMPTIALTKVDGHFNKESLEYEVSWGAIAESETEQLEDLSGYIIKTELENPVQDANGDENLKVQYFYVCSLFEGWDGTTLYQGVAQDWTEVFLAANGSSDVTALASKSNGEIKTIIDLSAYDSYEVVSITVQAIAKDGALYYIDGDESGANAVTIPLRLRTPSANMLSSTSVYDFDNVVVETELNMLGIDIAYENTGYTANDSGTIRMAVAIYESAPENLAETGVAARTGDSTIAGDGGWNDGALLTIASKSNPMLMSGTNLLNATAKINVDTGIADYAGMWIKIAVKATSNNAISSYWSDEDVDGDTQNYFWVQIPRVQLEDVVLTQSTITQYVADEQVEPSVTESTSDGSEGENPIVTRTSTYSYVWSENPSDIAITNRVVGFAPVKRVDGYTVVINGIDGGREKLYLQAVFASDGKTVTAMKVYADADEDGVYEEYLGTIAAGGSAGNGSIVLGYKAEIMLGAISYEDAENNKAALAELNEGTTTFSSAIWMDAEGKVQIMLPDVVALEREDESISSYAFTSEITVQEVVSHSTPDHITGYKPGSGSRVIADTIISGEAAEQIDAADEVISLAGDINEEQQPDAAPMNPYAITVYIKEETLEGEDNN